MNRLIQHLMLFLMMALLTFSPAAWADSSPEALQQINQLWQQSAHALSGINCSSCHVDQQTEALVVNPTQESCRSCHEQAVDTFLLGKHGIRLQEGQSPLTPAIARLPMQDAARDWQMTCSTCHDVHSVNTVQASVDSCLGCHSDTHSLNYGNSRHAQLFAAEEGLSRPSASSVTCATCHLPRHTVGSGSEAHVVVNHNNTYTLKPRDRMVKDVCMACHGMEYSYNSIFDDELVETNFDRPPQLNLQTLDMVRSFRDRRGSAPPT